MSAPIPAFDFLIAAARPLSAAAPIHLDGTDIPLYEALPFAGLLLSIALGPVFAKRLWHVHYGKAAAFWAALALALLIVTRGLRPTLLAFSHTMFADYLPFILMLFALYTAAGGIVVSELDRATPLTNTLLIALGTLLASVIGTTGASMILIRPILQANAKRRHQVHVVIFFIFLVANIGGVLSPLGDPPLFFGFLSGVDFFWPVRTLWAPMLFTSVLLLAIFYALDSYFCGKEIAVKAVPRLHLTLKGLANLVLIAAAVAVILGSAKWRPGVAIDALGTRLELQNLLRDIALAAIGLLSLAITPAQNRTANHFSWAPLEEVGKLFAAIFICIIPVMVMLQAGRDGPFAPAIALLAHQDGQPNAMRYFWVSGLLSSLLDNAPTYLIFFGFAGGDAAHLTGPLAQTLAAISLGAVFMGALTYIGNAPNFMVYALARRARVDMPGFFGYMAWSGLVLLPVFTVMAILFLR